VGDRQERGRLQLPHQRSARHGQPHPRPQHAEPNLARPDPIRRPPRPQATPTGSARRAPTDSLVTTDVMSVLTVTFTLVQ